MQHDFQSSDSQPSTGDGNYPGRFALPNGPSGYYQFRRSTADVVLGNALGIHPGNQYDGLGIQFRTGSLTGSVALNSTITLANPVDSFEVLGGAGQPAISPPNFAIPLGAGVNDLLMIFTTPVTSVRLTSDSFPETPDVIRLIALASTPAANQFIVVGFDEKFDNAVTPPGNLLSVSLGGTPFSFALFEVTTEQEGFDDLTFTPVPEPATLPLLALGAINLLCVTKFSVHLRADLKSQVDIFDWS